MDNFWTTLGALAAGSAFGALFGALKLPIPAPPTLAGVAGVAGVYVGFSLWQWIIERFF